MPETTSPTREYLGHYMVVELAPAQPESGKTQRWLIRNRASGAAPGVVEWHGSWRQYVYCPHAYADIVLAASCLDDISGFVKRVNVEHKRGRD